MPLERKSVRSSARTKENILAAAKTLFSQRGYPQVGIRDVAKLAGANNALIARYFGSKAGLFEACLIDSIDIKRIDPSKSGSFIDLFMAGLSGPINDAGGMVMLSTGDPAVREIIIRVTNTYVIPGLVRLIGPPRAEERALQMLILATGFNLSTRLLPVGPASSPEIEAWMRAMLEQILLASCASVTPTDDVDLAAQNADLRRMLVDLLLRNGLRGI